MTNLKSTRRALISSAIALLLCFSMLVGTTFAWFTDSVTSANNVIVSGNLDITLEYWDGYSWETVDGADKILDPDALWEPGYTEVVYLKLENKGSLALKYQIGANIVSETQGVNQAGEKFSLSDYIYMDVVEGVNGEKDAFDRAEAEAKKTELTLISAPYAKSGNLKAGDAPVYLAMIVYMPESVGNAANHNGKDVPEILLGINAFATQDTVESDSFDEKYDADTAVFTVADANAMLADGKDVTLVNCIEPEAVLFVPAGYQGTLTLQNVTIASVQEGTPASTTYMKLSTATAAPSETDIVILGNVVVKATEEGMSAITGTALNIRGNGNLTAIGKGDHAFGIGGVATESIKIEGVHIVDVRGGFVQPQFENDMDYGKSEPEGGAAIGSGFCGATIDLTNVTIDNAQGGSKAAGIGAKFHTGVTVNITNSVIKNVEGGNASAGIGGSRVSDDLTVAAQHVKINVVNSEIYAIGGQFGAGIGSGYDTHCGSNIDDTICTINIDAASKITAKGGKYAAGVGTGYHVAALAGKIDCEVNATAGESREKYTVAQAVGFGVVDHTREVAKLTTTAPSITYMGVVIGVPNAQVPAAGLAEAITNAASGDTVVLGSGNYSLPTLASKEGITIEGILGETVIGGENATTGFGGNFGKDTTIKNVIFNGGSNGVRYSYAKGGTSTFENCTFAGDSVYGFHIDQSNGATFIFNNCTFSGFNAFAGDLVKVVFNNCTFLHNGSYGHTNIWSTAEFNNCTFGDKASFGIRGDSAKIYVNGVEESYHHEFIGSAASLVAFKDSIAEGDAWKGQKVVLVNDIDLLGVEWAPVGNFGGTFDGNGKTISNLTIKGESNVGFFKGLNTTARVENVTFDHANVSGTHYVGVIVGWEGNETVNATINNCTVTNSTVTCDTDAANDNGDKAGAICGYAVSLNITNCTVKDTTVKAYRDFAGILGYAHKYTVVTGNTVENVTLVIDNEVNYKNYTTDAAHDANAIVGEAVETAVVKDNVEK